MHFHHYEEPHSMFFPFFVVVFVATENFSFLKNKTIFRNVSFSLMSFAAENLMIAVNSFAGKMFNKRIVRGIHKSMRDINIRHRILCI